MKSFSRVGEQLELVLLDKRLKRVVRPWGGRSPRDLTRSSRMFKLGASPPGGSAGGWEAVGLSGLVRDPDQLLLFSDLEGGQHG